jgi:hypothetical protein
VLVAILYILCSHENKYRPQNVILLKTISASKRFVQKALIFNLEKDRVLAKLLGLAICGSNTYLYGGSMYKGLIENTQSIIFYLI